MLAIVSVSFSNEAGLLKDGYSLLPKNLDFTSYKFIFRYPEGVLGAYKVTIIVSIAGTILSMFVTSMFAYVLSRKSFIFRGPFTFILIFTMLFNGGMVPFYILMTQWLKLRNSLLAYILPLLVVPMFVIILRTFFSTIPESLIESAKIDGAREFYIFRKIILPLSKPAIASIGFMILLSYWNDWLMGMFFIDDTKKITLQLMLNNMLENSMFMKNSLLGSVGAQINNRDFPTEGARMAMCIIAAGPMLFVFPFFQKYFVKGLTVGSIKG